MGPWCLESRICRQRSAKRNQAREIQGPGLKTCELVDPCSLHLLRSNEGLDHRVVLLGCLVGPGLGLLDLAFLRIGFRV